MSDQLERRVPAGWYEFDDRERYWDGKQWTDDYRGGENSGPQSISSSAGPQAIAPAGAGLRPITAEADSGRPIEYKVLTQKDRYFGGKFDPQKLEAALNSYAEQGWRVVGVATADIVSWGGGRQELVVVMGRPG